MRHTPAHTSTHKTPLLLLLPSCCCPFLLPEPAASTVCSSTATPRGLASTTSSARGQPTSGLAMTPGSARDTDTAAAAGMSLPSPCPASHRRPSLPLLALPNSGGSFSRTPSCAAALSAGCDSGRDGVLSRVASSVGHLAAGTPGGCVSVVGDSSAPGRCSIWQLLVELLMVNSSMGQAAALQQLAQTHDNRVVLPLQQAVSGDMCVCGGGGMQCAARLHALATAVFSFQSIVLHRSVVSPGDAQATHFPQTAGVLGMISCSKLQSKESCSACMHATSAAQDDPSIIHFGTECGPVIIVLRRL
jgi:hypothetical protein